MKSMIKEIKDRTDDISEFEKTMNRMKFEMAEVKVNMNKMSDALSKIVDESPRRDQKFVDESQRRDQQFEELWIRINEDIRTREQRTEARIADQRNILMQR